MAVRVRQGESLRLYARWAGCLVREIRMANPGIGGRLQAGQSLFIPMAENRTTAFLRKRNDYTQQLQQAADATEGTIVEAIGKANEAESQTYSVKRGDTA